MMLIGGILIGLMLFALRDELRKGGSLHPGDWSWLVTDDPYDGLLDMHLPEGWDEWDVMRTLDEIGSL